MSLSDAEVRDRVEAAESLLARIERMSGEDRAIASDALRLVLELHGEALGRLLARDVRNGGALLAFAAEDELLAHLLVLHDLHPDSQRNRVERALDEVRPTLASHGGDVELVSVDGGTVRLRLTGSCDGCPSSSATLRLEVEEAVRRHAPEVERVVAESAADGAPGASVPEEALQGGGERG